jgi:hypothetical protein
LGYQAAPGRGSLPCSVPWASASEPSSLTIESGSVSKRRAPGRRAAIRFATLIPKPRSLLRPVGASLGDARACPSEGAVEQRPCEEAIDGRDTFCCGWGRLAFAKASASRPTPEPASARPATTSRAARRTGSSALISLGLVKIVLVLIIVPRSRIGARRENEKENENDKSRSDAKLERYRTDGWFAFLGGSNMMASCAG